MRRAGTGDPPPELLRWATAAVGHRTPEVTATSMSQAGSGSPWRLDLHGGTRQRTVVLKAEATGTDERRRFATSAAALAFAEEHGVPAPRPIALDLEASTGWLAALTTLLEGTSSIAAGIPTSRLRALGGAAARIHLVRGTPTDDLPVRSRSLQGYDLDAGTPVTSSRPLLDRARAAIAVGAPAEEDPRGFVHGDLWQGNTLWDGDRYTGAIDWDFAGFGPGGVDLGSLRADVAVLHGSGAADEVLIGWETEVGAPAPNLAWWDVVAGASTPEDMGGWLPNFHAQGRTDLDLETVTRRRDSYLRRALGELD